MDILRLLDELNEHAVVRPRTIVGKFTYGLNKDEVAMQIAKVRATLPSELKAAAATVRESDKIKESAMEDAGSTLTSARREAERIVAEAKVEAERLIQVARLEQEKMVSESEILQLAKAQSEETRLQAEREASLLRRGADEYSYEVLSKLGLTVEQMMRTIDRGKAELESPKEAVAVVRDRARV